MPRFATSSRKRPKYGNKKAEQDGETFDSRKELRRWNDLQLLERAGAISDLRRQVPFELIPSQKRKDGSTERACRYVADFTYQEDGELVVEDSKSDPTRKLSDYIIKRKLLLFVHGITLRET